MNISLALIIIAIGLIVFLIYHNRKKKHALKAYESPSTESFEDKVNYQDEVDYFMTPVAQATRIENNPVPDKKALYNTYNEAVARYNKVSPKVRKNPKVPNIETIVGQRNKALREILAEVPRVVPTPRTMPMITAPQVVPIPVQPPVPVLKDKKREDRLKITVKSSAQNVHDHNVNDELSSRYKRIKESDLSPSSDQMYAEMVGFIDKNDVKGGITDGFKFNNPVSRFDNDTEDNIWYNVWRRIHAPGNAENIDSLKSSLREAVIDCTENNLLVCTTGRVTRALDSLTLLDIDDSISKPAKTDDIERKEVYDQAHAILHRELDKKGVTFKNAYESGEMDDTDAFDEKVRESIKKEVGTSKYLNDALAAI